MASTNLEKSDGEVLTAAEINALLAVASDKVGINTETPTEALEVGGSVKATGFKGNLTAATTYVTGVLRGITVFFTGLLTGVDAVFSGNVDAQSYTGDGSGLTGIASGTGGVINTGSTTIGADSNDDGTGEIALQTKEVTRQKVTNGGDFDLLDSDLLANGEQYLPNGAIGNINDDLLNIPMKHDNVALIGDDAVLTNVSTIRTFVDRYDIVKTAVANEARIEKLGQLIEMNDRTNECYPSVSSAGSPWALIEGTLNSDTELAPDGNLVASKITGSGLGTTIFNVPTITKTFTASATLNASVWLRSDTDTTLSITLFMFGGSGTISQTEEFTDVSAKWKRFEFNITNYVDQTSFQFQPIRMTAWSGTAEAWGAQVEESTYASSYMATTTLPVTIAGDVLEVPQEGNNPSNSDDMTMLITVVPMSVSVTQRIVNITPDPVALNAHYIQISSGGSVIIRRGDGNPTAISLSPLVAGERVAVGYRYNSTTEVLSLFINGVFNDSAVSPPVGINNLAKNIEIGKVSSFELFDGHVEHFEIKPRSLSDAEMRIAAA